MARGIVVAVFAMAAPQEPLFSSTQNTYFLHGLAAAGVGSLSSDWLAGTADPVPVFSGLVTAVASTLGANAFYLVQMGMMALYALALWEIGLVVAGIAWNSLASLAVVLFLTTLHSGHLRMLLNEVPLLSHYAWVFSPQSVLVSGVAFHHLYGPVLQPATFGILLLASFALWLRQRRLAGVVMGAMAAWFHPTYLVAVTLLFAAYAGAHGLRSRDVRAAGREFAASMLLLVPVGLYVAFTFSPTSESMFQQATGILALDRVNHHANMLVWLDRFALYRILWISGGLILLRRTRAGLVLLLAFIGVMVLSALQFVSGNLALALAFPWRLSAVLVPATTACLAAGCSRLLLAPDAPTEHRWRRLLLATGVVLLSFVAVDGFVSKVRLWRAPRAGLSAPALLLRDTGSADDVVLIPPTMETFRLAARVPVLVDVKSHPYKDIEVIEWFDRLHTARRLFVDTGQPPCEPLRDAALRYGITYVVADETLPVTRCPELHRVDAGAEKGAARDAASDPDRSQLWRVEPSLEALPRGTVGGAELP